MTKTSVKLLFASATEWCKETKWSQPKWLFPMGVSEIFLQAFKYKNLPDLYFSNSSLLTVWMNKSSAPSLEESLQKRKKIPIIWKFGCSEWVFGLHTHFTLFTTCNNWFQNYEFWFFSNFSNQFEFVKNNKKQIL